MHQVEFGFYTAHDCQKTVCVCVCVCEDVYGSFPYDGLVDGCNHIIHMFPSTPETKTSSFPTAIKQKIYQNLIKPGAQLSLFIFIKQKEDLQREAQRYRGQKLRGNETGETRVSTAGGVKITGFNGLERPHIRTQLSEKVGIWGIWGENWRRAVSFFLPGTVPGRSENSQDTALG